jgi:hypothetical protein
MKTVRSFLLQLQRGKSNTHVGEAVAIFPDITRNLLSQVQIHCSWYESTLVKPFWQAISGLFPKLSVLN